MGEERLLLNFYDDPSLVRDFMNTLADFWIELWGQALSEIRVDCVNFWEDMAYRRPLISPEMFREFMRLPTRRSPPSSGAWALRSSSSIQTGI
jgi:hypothetical protein